MFESKTSAIPYANTFLAHWGQVETAIAGQPTYFLPQKKGIIPPNFNRSGLVALKDVLEGQLDAVQASLNDLQINSGAIGILKATLLKRLRLFLDVFDSYYGSSEFANARPDAPNIGDGPEKFLAPLRDAKNLWLRVNGAAAPGGITLPLKVDEGTLAIPALVTQAQFDASITALKALYEARAQFQQDLILLRARRDETITSIYNVLLAYRESVPTRISTNTALLSTIPRLTPVPGHTPDAVTATAIYEAPDTARITHSESAEATFESYTALAAAGDDASVEDAIVIGIHTDRTPAEFITHLGLSTPGGAVTVWVKVTLTTGNERTSAPVVVNRPV